ncbi:MAG: hypothetical protein AAGC60_21780 [Acidobacteriota bacterium]
MTHRQHLPKSGAAARRGAARRLAGVVLAGLLVAPVVLPAPAAAQLSDSDGLIRIGYRFVDIDGAERKYREDLNLDEGARLFELRLDATDLGSALDRATLDIDNYGGDPFETLRLDLRKHGSWNFSYQRTKSAYFYDDLILPVEQAGDPALALAGDFHTFDFDRVRDTAKFGLRFSPRAKLDVGLERWTKRGESTTTLDISRDEFEFDQPIDDSFDQLRVGFTYDWGKTTLVLEERITEQEYDVSIFLPGASLGEDPNDATTLDFFFFDRPATVDSNTHTARIVSRPADRWTIRAAASVIESELDTDASQEGRGTAFTGQPLDIDIEGDARVEYDAEVFDFDLSYLINERLALVGGLRRHAFDQQGDVQLNVDGESVWDVETTGAELGLEAQLTATVTLSGGVRYESRDVEHAQTTSGPLGELEEYSTDHDGFWTSLGWNASKQFRLEVTAETSSYDDPFTLTSPSDRERLRLHARWNGDQGVYFDAIAVANSWENDDSGWEADTENLSLRAGVRRDTFDLRVGYTMVETDRSIDQLVTTLPGFGGGQTFLFPTLYESGADFIDLRARWRPNDRLQLGADALLYDNTGSFGLEREDLRAYVQVGLLDGYLVQLAYRTVDYTEEAQSFDDYEAEIAELSVGYRW